MLLLFDAGNTRLKWALAGHDHKVVNNGASSYEELDMALRHIRSVLPTSTAIQSVAVSSVAGEQRNSRLAMACEDVFGLPLVFAKVSKAACGVENDYQALNRLGVDRWVAAMGVASQLGINRVIVDAGTAVTVDLLAADNTFLGGVILPGVKLMHDSLVGETAGIHSELGEVASVIGKTFGLVGSVDRVLDEFALALDNSAPWQVVVCGGDAAWLSELMKTSLPVSVSDNLIFNGLLAMYKSEALK